MHAPGLVSSTTARRGRIELGDWQTPPALAEAVLRLVRRDGAELRAVLEPTCGTGAFLKAAHRAFPEASLSGFELSAERLAAARRELDGSGAVLTVADFFGVSWERVLGELPEPFLLVGNPPWVTSTTLGVLASANLPEKVNVKGEAGLDALTGKSNFDISEWMLLRLLEAAQGKRFTLGMLCKSAVARRVMQECAERGWALEGAVYGVDAKAHFAAAVSAVLLVLRSPAGGGAGVRGEARFAVFPSLEAREPASHMGVSGGRLYSDFEAYEATRALAGSSELAWRSGVKHDLARVMELTERDGALRNGLGEAVSLEPDFLYPLCKGSDLAHGAARERRFLIVTQGRLGEDTSRIREQAPATWRYLERHRAAFDARKSRIYRGQPPFALFGVGDYTFAPYKVAISGLHKRLAFRVLSPLAERPMVLDDTTYFLPCTTLAQAEGLARALSSPLASCFFEARIFWDAMRPINKALLGSLSLEKLALALAERGEVER